MSLLRIEDLTVAIGNARVLQDVSLNVDPGQIVALTGESGSGKSMTALAIMGLLPDAARPTGTIHLDGEDLFKATEAQMCSLRGARMGMVFQEPMTALNPVRTIGDQVMEHVYLHRPGQDAELIARKALSRVGLPPNLIPLSRYPHELSGGQRQRVVIAIAIACSPRLLIADEPTTALDVTTQAQILTLLKRLVKEDGMGLILITHDLAVVADIADDILVMKDGEIVETGPPETLFAKMQHPYTRALFEASGHRVDLPEVENKGPKLQVKDLIRSYRRGPFKSRFKAVDGVSFEIGTGERVGLVGESGCGKSTLARALLGLEKAQAGEILLGGTPVRSARHMRGRLQIVFQDPYGSFNPRHRVGRLISESFHPLTEKPDKAETSERVAETLEAVGLSAEDANRYPHQFSGGQRQRIAIARALITRPELVIFDEAVSALDVSVRARILDLIADLCHAYALTYLFISHDLHVVRSVTDRVLVMKAGQIVEEGPTERVLTSPEHDYTRSLIEAAPRLPEF